MKMAALASKGWSGLHQQILILTQFREPEVCSQGINAPSDSPRGESFFAFSGFCQLPLFFASWWHNPKLHLSVTWPSPLCLCPILFS